MALDPFFEYHLYGGAGEFAAEEMRSECAQECRANGCWNGAVLRPQYFLAGRGCFPSEAWHALTQLTVHTHTLSLSLRLPRHGKAKPPAPGEMGERHRPQKVDSLHIRG
jgi:hypothetical protein